MCSTHVLDLQTKAKATELFHQKQSLEAQLEELLDGYGQRARLVGAVMARLVAECRQLDLCPSPCLLLLPAMASQ